MKTKLLLSVGLLVALVAPLRAQAWFETVSWVDVHPWDGAWSAGAYTLVHDDYNCDWCSAYFVVSSTIYQDNNQLTQVSGDGTGDNGASDGYTSPDIVELGSAYEIDSLHTWQAPPDPITGYPGPSGGMDTNSAVQVPGVPTIKLNGVDASNPPLARWSYFTYPNGFQSLYSSTLIIGDLNAISSSTENPTFTFDQTQYPGLSCGPGTCPVTTPVIFQGYLAGHYFYGPQSEVTVQLGMPVTDSHNSEVNESTEITGGLPTGLLTTHTATENFDFYTYDPFVLFASLPEYVVHLNSAHSTMDTHLNICAPAGPPECDIAGIGEVNRWPFPPYPAANNDPMPRVPIGLPPGYKDPNTLWAQEVDYFGLWLTEGTGFAVCNTLFAVENYAASFADLTPMGCIGLTLP